MQGLNEESANAEFICNAPADLRFLLSELRVRDRALEMSLSNRYGAGVREQMKGEYLTQARAEEADNG